MGPPEGVEPEHSYPVLKLCAALKGAQAFEALAAKHPSDPPCLAATCDAVIFRPCSRGSQDEGLDCSRDSDTSAAVLEEWSLRFCFGPRGFRHAGHGECDGYDAEFSAAGRRRWRPVELCYARATPGSRETPFAGMRLLFRGRRCEG